MVLYCVGYRFDDPDDDLRLVASVDRDGIRPSCCISGAMILDNYAEADALVNFLTCCYEQDFLILGFDPNLYDDVRRVSTMLNEMCIF